MRSGKIESWVWVWRNGFAPLLSTDALKALEDGLEQDDTRIIQQSTTDPPPFAKYWACPLAGACPVCYSLWRSGQIRTVREAEEVFANLCFLADGALGTVGASRHFLTWVDETARETVRGLLLPEVRRALSQRTPVAV